MKQCRDEIYARLYCHYKPRLKYPGEAKKRMFRRGCMLVATGGLQIASRIVHLQTQEMPESVGQECAGNSTGVDFVGRAMGQSVGRQNLCQQLMRAFVQGDEIDPSSGFGAQLLLHRVNGQNQFGKTIVGGGGSSRDIRSVSIAVSAGVQQTGANSRGRVPSSFW